MDNLSPKAQAGLLIAFLVLAYVLGYFLVFKGWYQQITAFESQIQKVEADIQKGRMLQMRVNEFNRQINDLKEQLGKLKEIMPTKSEAGKFYSNLNLLANESQVYIQSIKAANRIPTDVYTELPYNLDLKARYHDIGQFFASLANFPKIINVRDLNMASLDKGGKFSITVSCVASTFIYNEGTDDLEEAGGAN